jgi:hypothetical protein
MRIRRCRTLSLRIRSFFSSLHPSNLVTKHPSRVFPDSRQEKTDGRQGFRKVGWIPALAMGELIFLGGDQPQIRSGAAPVRCETTTHLSFERWTV